MIPRDTEEGDMFMSLRDWKTAVKAPTSYRIGKTTTRHQMQLLIGLTLVCLLFLWYFYSSDEGDNEDRSEHYKYVPHPYQKDCIPKWKYNYSYPLTKPKYIHDSFHFKIGLVSDMDHNSRSKLESNTWISYYLQGNLIWNPLAQTVNVNFDKNNFKTLKTKYSYDGRGMELSELITFNGKLTIFDDRAGIVFVMEDNSVYPWILLTGGNGKLSKGFKIEWATVKDEHLYLGSLGKEWTTPHGEFVNYDPMFVKRISPTGSVESLDWVENYKALRSKLGIHFPGYLLHEAVAWSDVHRKWFFLPRRLSLEVYHEETDEIMGTNLLLTCDEDFKNVNVVTIGEVIPTHGFSSFKFIPGTNDEVIIALKTVEYKGKLASYIMAFTINGKILMGETKIDDTKYEGIDFI